MDELIEYLEKVPRQNISIRPSEALSEYLICREYQKKIKEHVRRLISCACFGVRVRLLHKEEPLVYFATDNTILVDYKKGKIIYAFAKVHPLSASGYAETVLNCLEMTSRVLKLELEKRDKLCLKGTELKHIIEFC